MAAAAPEDKTPAETAAEVRQVLRAKARHIANLANSTSDDPAAIENRRRVMAGSALWAKFSIQMKQFAFYVAQGRIPANKEMFERMVDKGLVPRGAVCEGAYDEYAGPPDYR